MADSPRLQLFASSEDISRWRQVVREDAARVRAVPSPHTRCLMGNYLPFVSYHVCQKVEEQLDSVIQAQRGGHSQVELQLRQLREEQRRQHDALQLATRQVSSIASHFQVNRDQFLDGVRDHEGKL